MLLAKLPGTAGSSSAKKRVLAVERIGWFIRGGGSSLVKLSSLNLQLVGHFIPAGALCVKCHLLLPLFNQYDSASSTGLAFSTAVETC